MLIKMSYFRPFGKWYTGSCAVVTQWFLEGYAIKYDDAAGLLAPQLPVSSNCHWCEGTGLLSALERIKHHPFISCPDCNGSGKPPTAGQNSRRTEA